MNVLPIGKRVPRKKPVRESGLGLVCLSVLVILATISIAGCMESAPGVQDRIAATNDPESENPAEVMTLTTGTKDAPEQTGAAQSPAADPSAPFIAVDPISDMNIGDLLVISGITNLPERTTVSLTMIPGVSGDEQMMSKRQILSGTDGINRFRFAFDTSGFRPGTYRMIVSSGNNDVSGSAQFSLTGTFLGTDNPIYYSGASKSTGSAGAPYISVPPQEDRQQGEIFRISGETSLPAGTILFYRVYPAYYEDRSKKPAATPGESLMDNIGGDTIVIRGTGTANMWSFAMDTDGFKKMEYIVNVSTTNRDFTVLEIFGRAQLAIR